MAEYQWRLCRYSPDIRTLAECFDFAVVCASENKVALMGVNLKEYGLAAAHPFALEMIHNSFDVIWRRIRNVISEYSPESGFSILEKLDGCGPTNVWFTDIVDVDGQEDLLDLASAIACEFVRPSILRARPAGAEPMWRAEPEMQEKEQLVTA